MRRILLSLGFFLILFLFLTPLKNTTFAYCFGITVQPDPIYTNSTIQFVIPTDQDHGCLGVVNDVNASMGFQFSKGDGTKIDFISLKHPFKVDLTKYHLAAGTYKFDNIMFTLTGITRPLFGELADPHKDGNYQIQQAPAAPPPGGGGGTNPPPASSAKCGDFILNSDTCPADCPKTEVASGVFKCLAPQGSKCDPYAPNPCTDPGNVCKLVDPATSTWQCGKPDNGTEWVGKDLCTKDGSNYKCNTGLGFALSTSPGAFVSQIFGVVLGIAGTIALILIIISGYKLMTSQGDAEKVKDARDQLTAAIIGLLFVIFSFFLLTFIGGTILGIYK